MFKVRCLLGTLFVGLLLTGSPTTASADPYLVRARVVTVDGDPEFPTGVQRICQEGHESWNQAAGQAWSFAVAWLLRSGRG